VTTHLVTAVTSQDGIWLARRLLSLGHTVVGTVLPETHERLVYVPGVRVEPLDVRETAAFAKLVDQARPDVVHNLAALTSVGDSWAGSDDVRAVNQQAVERMLDVLLDLPRHAPGFVQASSGEIFGAINERTRADEQTPLRPVSPYGEAKAAAHRAVMQARESGLRATNLILFGHTSSLQSTRFALPLIAEQAAAVGLGEREAVVVRDPTACRDWGSAPDFVRAFVAAAEAPAGDFVVATGSLHSLSEVGRWALTAAGAPDAEVRSSGASPRPTDVGGEHPDIEGTGRKLGWAPEVSLREEIERMVRVARRRLASGIENDPAYLLAD
jgi:GDPmannose 4,6-dehydratase